MKMQMAPFNNVWHVNSVPVDNIILFSASRGEVLLDTGAQWISPEHSSNAAGFVEQVEQVVDRRKVCLTRNEHFLLAAKGRHVLYLNADRFTDNGRIDLAAPDWRPWYTDHKGTHEHFGMTVYLTLTTYPGAAPTAVFIRRQNADAVRTIVSEEGARLTKITDLINSKLHRNNHLSEYQVNDILTLLPQINAIHSGK